MKRYVMLQAPKTDIEYSQQIVIIDNETHIGRGKVEHLLDQGYNHLGFVEVNDESVKPSRLIAGFSAKERGQLERIRDTFRSITSSINEHQF